ncbi:MAG: sulfurtransferase complex subunit TusB [Chromatiales bacterium]
MSMLHIVNKSPYERNSLTAAVGHMKDADTLLLIEDGVYAAVKGGAAAAELEGKTVSVLGADLAARGIGVDKLVDGASVVDYSGFVDLVESTDKSQSWL